MKRTLFYIIGAMLLFSACSTQIDEDQRLTYVKPAAVGKNVLLVDFTGQRCINCPTASHEIEKIQEQYSADTVIAVGMHSGPLGFRGNAKTVGLSTTTGDNYYRQWNVEYQPQGVIDYLGKSDYTAWGGIVHQQLKQTAPLNIKIDAKTNGTSGSGSVSLEGLDGNIQGKLQLWIVEDSITALQMMPDGTTNRNYLHMHVFRTAVNGEAGESVNVKEGETTTINFSTDFATTWVPRHLWLIAFVYNESGVLQVKRAAFKAN